MNEKKLIKRINELKRLADKKGIDISEEIEKLEEKLKEGIFDKPVFKSNTDDLKPWERVKISRLLERPKPQDIIEKLIDNFIEFHGDRGIADDKAIIGGIGYFKGIPVTVIGTRKGKDLNSNMEYNFGMPHPEGYRKALRLAKQAEKFKRPVLFFVDTPGAFCGIDAEEHGIAEAIARNLYEFSSLKTILITTITGEGGSGGALALSVSDKIYMFENAIFSVISPEGCASILFKDASKASVAAESLKLTADDLYKLGIIDFVIPEFKTLDKNPDKSLKLLEQKIYEDLFLLKDLEPYELIKQRYEKYRKIGFFEKEQIPIKEKVKQQTSLFKKLFKFK